MKLRCRWRPSASATVLILVTIAGISAQVRYERGQDVVPVFEGWERNADGTINMVFGYMNRNYEEEVDIPVGPDNMIAPGPVDQGQPGHFYARRQQFVFKVKVPKDWGDKDLIWTLRSAGKTEKAYGSLLATWEIGNLVYQENRKGSGDLIYPEQPNRAPTIEMVGSARRTIAAGEPLSLSVEVSDDGYPIPRIRPVQSAKPPGDLEIEGPKLESPMSQAVVKLDRGVRLGVTWVLYRGGPGTVTFNPMRVPVVVVPSNGAPPTAGLINGKATTTAIFSQPGTYELRAYADDGVLTTPVDVVVRVQESEQH
jgi:hypothetical protein